MPKVVRATTSLSSQPAPSALVLRMPPAMVETAAERLGWISLLCAVTAVVWLAVNRVLQPEIARAHQDSLLALMGLAVILFSAAMVAIRRFSLLSNSTVLQLGLVFEIFVAFVIAFVETSTQISPDQVVRGGSLVAVWITVCGLLIPNTPALTCLAALASAAMWPAAYRLNEYIHGFDAVPVQRLAVFNFINFTMACWAYFLNRRIYAIEVSAQRAQDLGSYELVSRLGKGGMGEVWRARHRLLARDAAIKVIRPEVLARQPGRQAEVMSKRFQREARSIANLSSPHTVSLYDFGSAQDGSFYYVMELLTGIDLQSLVERFGPVEPARVAYILQQVCDSLEEAHRAGLVHRDIKPTNLYLCVMGTQFDFAKVLDFGLVKNLDNSQATQVTMEGMAAGTPAYMAPEVAMGEREIDGRTDLYSLGCVAYFLLTGAPVFSENSATATALAHVQKSPVPPSQRSELPIPKDLEELVIACLAKKRENRPVSAQEVQRRLADLECAGQWGRDEAVRWWKDHLPSAGGERSEASGEARRIVAAADR